MGSVCPRRRSEITCLSFTPPRSCAPLRGCPTTTPERPWEDAADLAADWIWQRSEDEDAAPLLVTNTFQNDRGIHSLQEVAQEGGHATPQGRDRFGAGPVLAYVPNAKTLDFAVGLAHGYSLVVVESVSFPLAEWAAGAGALNLLDGTTTSSAISDDVKRDLDFAIRFGGNNGWSGSHEKQHARRYLRQHAEDGRLDPDAAAAYVMAHGVSAKGAKRLRELLSRG